MSISFFVPGKPAQMGSKKGFVVAGRAVITDVNSEKRKLWANAVSSAASEAMKGNAPIAGAVMLQLDFAFLRPQGHYGSGKNAAKLKFSAPQIHVQSPDLDKLVRCVLDALTGIAYRDDRQVFTFWAVRSWSESKQGCTITVTEVNQ